MIATMSAPIRFTRATIFSTKGRRIVGPLGYRPSRKNPTICAVCVETSPPGGMKMHTGVLFADLD